MRAPAVLLSSPRPLSCLRPSARITRECFCSYKGAPLCRLVPLGIVIGVRRKKACDSLFFVKKKDGLIRMIVDGREPSAYHKLPPHSSMASVEAIVALRVGQAWAEAAPGGLPAEDL